MKKLLVMFTAIIFISNIIGSCIGNSSKTIVESDDSFVNNNNFDGKFGIFKDERDSQTYKWIRIGNQIWMAQNLNFKTDESWCYNFDEGMCTKYGRLYTWEEANKVSPKGWHLPDNADWKVLIDSLGDMNIVGDKLKSITGWKSPNTNATNVSGFNALPSGSRYPTGTFGYVEESCILWSADNNPDNVYYAYAYILSSRSSSLESSNTIHKANGLAIRCVKDN